MMAREPGISKSAMERPPFCVPAGSEESPTKLWSAPASGLLKLGALVGLVALASFLFFYRLADRELSSSHEARAAQDAQSILSDNQWALPRLFDRKAELQKPPMYYWLVAAIAYVRDVPVDAWAVRLPPAFAALGGVLLLYGLGILRGRALAGLLGATILASALHYTWLARVGRIDMPLALAVSSALCAFYMGLGTRGQGSGVRDQFAPVNWFLIAYLACAIGALLKGPIGVVLPVAVAVIFLFVEGALPPPRQPRRYLRLGHELGLAWGIPLFLALVLPWYMWSNLSSGGQFFQVFFWKHNIERGLGGGTLAAHPWWFYGPRLAMDLLPWSLLLPTLAWVLFRRGWWREDPEARFGLVWLLTITAVLSCSRFKRADYLLPAYPGAALFIGCTAERWYRAVARKRLLALAFCLTLGGCVAGWWVYIGYVLPGQESRDEVQRFAQEIRRRAPMPQLILFFRTEAHTLAFHVGRPIDTLLEWENLDTWAGRPEIYHVVMPAEYAKEWSRHLKSGRLEEVLRSKILGGSGHDDPLVLLRTEHGAPRSGAK
jgi:4-amino-4-deoxy-L-arabinose transferase-like glycosyltransferase